MATATASGTFKIGGDLEVTRLGYGAMRLTGEGIWGPPADHDAAIAVLKALPELASRRLGSHAQPGKIAPVAIFQWKSGETEPPGECFVRLPRRPAAPSAGA